MTDYTDMVHLRLTPEQKKTIQKAARRDDESVSAWLREMAVEEAEADESTVRLMLEPHERLLVESAASLSPYSSLDAWVRGTVLTYSRRLVDQNIRQFEGDFADKLDADARVG